MSVRVNVPLVKELALSFTRDAIQLAKKHGIDAILLDVRGQRTVDGVYNQYDYACKLQELGMTPWTRIAVLADPDDNSHDFFETVTRNRGFHFQLFRDELKAHDWLRKINGHQQTDSGDKQKTIGSVRHIWQNSLR
ncbi:hypothetical protein ACFL0M_12975 [Thermodesulfobacteriota bacterium]